MKTIQQYLMGLVLLGTLSSNALMAQPTAGEMVQGAAKKTANTLRSNVVLANGLPVALALTLASLRNGKFAASKTAARFAVVIATLSALHGYVPAKVWGFLAAMPVELRSLIFGTVAAVPHKLLTRIESHIMRNPEIDSRTVERHALILGVLIYVLNYKLKVAGRVLKLLGQ